MQTICTQCRQYVHTVQTICTHSADNVYAVQTIIMHKQSRQCVCGADNVYAAQTIVMHTQSRQCVCGADNVYAVQTIVMHTQSRQCVCGADNVYAVQTWDVLNTMMAKNTKKQELKCDYRLTFANDLNVFYFRLDSTYFSREIDDVCQPLLTIPFNIRLTESDVKNVFSQLKPRKACGPDGVGGKVLRKCSNSLSSVF